MPDKNDKGFKLLPGEAEFSLVKRHEELARASGFPAKRAAENALALLEAMRSGQVKPVEIVKSESRQYTNEERLAYYRSHGLVSCDDYPGGDVAFEADVLSGCYHDRVVVEGPPKREDAYVIQCMYDDRFTYDTGIDPILVHPELILAYRMTCGRRGIYLRINWTMDPMKFEEYVKSGQYARDVIARRDRRGR